MKKLLSFTKKKKNCGTSDNVSALSDGYDLKDKDLGKIHKAVSQGDLDKLKPLAKKSDINQLDKENRTPLHIACATGHDEVVQFLVDSKAKLNLRDNQNRSALMKAVECQHERSVAILLENHADPNLGDVNGNTALHLAANIPSIPTAKRLLEHGADINAPNKEGFTPLTVAIREDRIDMAEFLLKETADVNSLDHEQRSPLMLAASNGQHSMVRLLLQFDPDITLRDKKGWTADDYAQKNGHHSCCLLITEYGTKRTHKASVSRPGPYKKKKPPGIPFHDPEPGFSLGGPATDKELEDNSLSESVSRASKSANDEWPSTEDEDDSSVGKKPLKVNLSRILGSKMGEAPVLPDTSLSDTESEPLCKTSVPVDSSTVPTFSKSPLHISRKEEGSDGEDSGEEVEEEDEEEEEEEEDEDDEEEEGEEDDEESDENEEEDGSEEEEESHNQNCSATDIRADTQNTAHSKSCLNAGTPAKVKHEIDKAETENMDVNSPAGAKTSAVPATLDVAGDCIVSAIRVESKLSDEEESVAKECMRSSAQTLNSNQSSVEVPIPPEATQSPGKVEEVESDRETENDDKDSLSDETNGVDKVWNDSDDEGEDEAEGIGGSTLITCPGKLSAKVVKKVKSDVEDDALSSREPVEEGRRKSSWGSSIEGSDADLPKESEANIEVLEQKNDVQPLDMQLEEKEEQPDTSWDSSTQCVLPEQVIDDPGLPSSPQAKNKPIVATAVESDWDSSEVKNENDTGAQSEITSLDLNKADNEMRETHKCSLQEEKKTSTDTCPMVSVPVECEDAKDPILRDDDEPAGSDPLKEEKSDSENEEGNSSSWDDDYEEESDESDKEEGEKAKTDNIQTEHDTEEIPYSYIDGNYEAEDEAKARGEALVVDEDQSKDVESSEDSDSRHQKLQYDFASATVKLLDVGGDSGGLCEKSADEGEARLTSYAPLETETGTRQCYDEDQRGEVVFSNSPIKDDYTSGQHHLSEVSDEALPQTDIDDVDLSSPDRSENTSLRWHELNSTEEPGIQKQNFTEGEKDNDRKEKDEKDSSNADSKPQDSGDVHNGVPTVHKVEVSKDIKRDFRLELGLTKGEGDESSWDSEPNSELSNVPHKEEPHLHNPNKEGKAPVEDSLKENVFYVPSFLRGEGGSRMAEIEPRKNVGLPQGSQGEAGSDSKDDQRELPEEDNRIQKKKESSEALSVLSKGNVNILDELGVGDIDDLEDESDWDSASTISKRTPPGLKFPSSGLEEFQKDGSSSGGGQKEDRGLPRTSTPKRSSSFGKSLPSTPSIFALPPQPRTTRASFQTADDEEDSDSEIEKTRGSRENSPTGKRRRSTLATVDQSKMADNTQESSDLEEQQEKEKGDALDGCEFSLHSLGRAGSDTEAKVDGDPPWEKRYEKLWVEVEKREVKSTFKNVAGELKERFGELFESGRPAKTHTEDGCPASSSAGEGSSDEEEEDVVRPTARARSTVLLTIPEQRESGQEESVAESLGSSLREETPPDCDQDVNDSFTHRKSALLTADVEANATSQLTVKQDEGDTDRYSKPASQDNGVALLAADSAGSLHEAGWSNTGSEESQTSEPALQHRCPGVSNGEGPEEEDMMRFNPEMADKSAGAMVPHRKSCISCIDSEATGSERPGTSVCLSLVQAGRSSQEQQIDVTPGTPIVQSCSGIKQNAEGKLQLELMVHWARQSGGPQANDQPEVEGSTLSDISDDEEVVRSPATDRRKSKVQSLDMSVPDDLEELTQSSDSDDADSAGYRHAAACILKLDSFALDATTLTKIENIFHEYERTIQKLRSRHGHLSEKVKQLDVERTSLKALLEEVRDARALLERNQLEIQTELTNVKFQLKQEQENRQNASMMYDTTKDKLRRMEEQHQFEVHDKQKVELSLRNMELEMRTLNSNLKQLEEEQHETQKMLAQERTSRALQENLLNNHLRKQKEMEEENRKSITRSNEALSQLTEAGDRERELLHQINSLHEQLTMLKRDFEHYQADSGLKETTLSEEKEALKEQLEDLRQDLKHSNETVTQTVYACNNQLSAMKTEMVKTTTQLEQERQARETLEAEAEATRSRLAAAVKEIELRLANHADTEKALLREKEEHQRHKDRLTNEIVAQRQALSNLRQKVAKAEANTNTKENEIHRVAAQLAEKNLLLDALLKEKDFGMTRAKELESTLQAEKEQTSRNIARQAAAEERLTHVQSETVLLRQQLEETQNQVAAKERAMTEAQQRFSDMLTKLRSDCEERVQLVEERNKELTSKVAELRDLTLKLEEEKNERENSVRKLQQELADSLKKLSMCEASLEVLTRHRNDLEKEKTRLLKDIERLREKLEETEDKYLQAERRISSLKAKIEELEKELNTTIQKLQESVAAIVASEITTKQLEEAMQRLEIENATLENTTKQQADKIEALEKSVQEAAMVRAHLEEVVSSLQSNKISLEDQLTKEMHKQSLLSITMQDSQALWEEETKNRSKLGLRLTELEREKAELTNQMEIEKKKAKKIAEQKKVVDTRLDEEMKRNMELQKEMHRQRALLKTAKKKLQGQENGGTSSPEKRRPGQADEWMKEKVEELQAELDKETSRRYQLEQINEELQDQLSSQKGKGRKHGELERTKRQLEDELLELRRQLENLQPDQSVLDQYRRDAEEKARQEMQQKLEQVNLFLQSQAASQEALDEIKAANEANLRSQLEQKIRELEVELNRARSSQQETFSQKETTRVELERYRHLYNEEMRLRMSLAAKLERANSRLSEANSKLLSERSRSLMMGNIGNGGLMGPSLDMSALATPANPGTSVGTLNRKQSVGYSLPSTESDEQNQKVEDYLSKMQRELDKNISKELRHATAELDAASARLSPVGSASRVELDPLSWATQQYLEVLKKNRRI